MEEIKLIDPSVNISTADKRRPENGILYPQQCFSTSDININESIVDSVQNARPNNF